VKVSVNGKQVDAKTLSDEVAAAQESWIASVEVLARARERLAEARREESTAACDATNAQNALEKVRKALDEVVRAVAPHG